MINPVIIGLFLAVILIMSGIGFILYNNLKQISSQLNKVTSSIESINKKLNKLNDLDNIKQDIQHLNNEISKLKLEDDIRISADE